jgi:23S rRNA pseudouridine1911/1915/1917 synthase
MQEESVKDNPDIEDNNDDLYERFSIIIDKGQEQLRIDKFLVNRIEEKVRNKVQKAINLV